VTAAVLEVSGLRVRREGRAILDGLSLTVARASLHAIVGPNGGGKSTLLEVVLGQTPFEGAVRLHLSKGARIGYVPQSFDVDPTLPVTVGELLALSRQRRPVCSGIGRQAKDAIARALSRAGLTGFEERRLGVLSGGELRRVLLANAMDPPPELLLLDEPGGGLDEKSLALLEALLGELKGAGTTILLVTHDREQVDRVADDVTHVGAPPS
jgi:zinc transport system ATP-binding protein